MGPVPCTRQIPSPATYFVASAIRVVGVSRDIGGISSSSKPASHIGLSASLSQLVSSQPARMNFVSRRRERSRISFRLPQLLQLQTFKICSFLHVCPSAEPHIETS